MSNGAVAFDPRPTPVEIHLATDRYLSVVATGQHLLTGRPARFWIKRRLVTNDGAMRLGVISAAYTDNGEPVVRWHPNTVHSR